MKYLKQVFLSLFSGMALHGKLVKELADIMKDINPGIMSLICRRSQEVTGKGMTGNMENEGLFVTTNYATDVNSGGAAADAYRNLASLNFDKIWEVIMNNIN